MAWLFSSEITRMKQAKDAGEISGDAADDDDNFQVVPVESTSESEQSSVIFECI